MIDFELIWKKIHGIISEAEEERLNQWLDASPGHRELYRKAVDLYHSEKGQINQVPDVDKAWNRMEAKLNPGGKVSAKVFYAFGIAVSIAAIVLFAVFYDSGKSGQTTGSQQTAEMKHIEPGTQKARLVLADGTDHCLKGDEEFLMEEGEVTIKSKNARVEYIRKNKKAKEIKYNKLIIPRGGEFFVILSDSTKVWLNSETVLRYPVQFPQGKREVELIGEAFFEVKKDQHHPFRVISGQQVIEVLGTSFNVSSYHNDSLIFTTLTEGIIEVYQKDNPDLKQKLHPDYQSYLYKGTGDISLRKVNPYPYIAWKEGRFYFENQPLDEIMRTLSRWYNIDITITSRKTKEVKFTGNLKRYHHFEEILKLLEKTHEIKYAIKDEKVVIH